MPNYLPYNERQVNSEYQDMLRTIRDTGARVRTKQGVDALAAGGASTGVIGPKNHIQPSGRKLAPVGKLTPVGNHPGGGALTPNGREETFEAFGDRKPSTKREAWRSSVERLVSAGKVIRDGESVSVSSASG